MTTNKDDNDKHSPEPWTYTIPWGSLGRVECKKGKPIPLDIANARRIVAAVNACAGIPTEELENPPESLTKGLKFLHMFLKEMQDDEK